MNNAIDPAVLAVAQEGSSHPHAMDAYWMPFTANRQFKKAPRLLAKAKDMHFWTPEGRQILDGIAGLWCVNAGHARPKIVKAIAEQAAELDYAPPFNMAHPRPSSWPSASCSSRPAGWTRCSSPTPAPSRWTRR